MTRRAYRMETYEPPQAESRISAVPDGPTHCACGAYLEPLRRTAGLCQACIGKRFTLVTWPWSESARVPAAPGMKSHPPCVVCRKRYLPTWMNQKVCSNEVCRKARRKLYSERAKQRREMREREVV